MTTVIGLRLGDMRNKAINDILRTQRIDDPWAYQFCPVTGNVWLAGTETKTIDMEIPQSDKTFWLYSGWEPVYESDGSYAGYYTGDHYSFLTREQARIKYKR